MTWNPVFDQREVIGFSSGLAFLFIIYGIYCAFLLAATAPSFSILLPNLVQYLVYFKLQSTCYFIPALYSLQLIVLISPTLLLEYLIFLSAIAKTPYYSASLFFVGSFLYFALFSLLHLYFNSWQPFPLFKISSTLAGVFFVCFLFIQLFVIPGDYSYR